MISDEEAARRLVESVPMYTPAVQADRRALVRRRAHTAAHLLLDASETDDPELLSALVCEADRALRDAVTETMRASLK
jgi:hypothetical protein